MKFVIHASKLFFLSCYYRDSIQGTKDHSQLLKEGLLNWMKADLDSLLEGWTHPPTPQQHVMMLVMMVMVMALLLIAVRMVTAPLSLHQVSTRCSTSVWW